MSGEKVIKDPVHGYIAIPREYCQRFVDTPIFQRLRLIEQTSMRWLFPSARHDRFIHSLGVYHLASRIYEAIQANVQDDEIKALLENSSLKSTFLVASLMHDCGHSPFSHTFEKFYNRNSNGSVHNVAFRKLREIAPKEDAYDLDFTRIRYETPSEHEAMSAYVLLSSFSDAMKKVGADPGLAARMITGASYGGKDSFAQGGVMRGKRRGGSLGEKDLELREKVANVFIALVNGKALDVDKLDYTIRDTWASGVKNTAIDVDRLIRGATIVRTDSGGTDDICFAFKRSAISVVQSVIDARNYLYNWVYGHHTVLYYSHLLERAVVKFSRQYAKQHKTAPATVLRRMFSPEMFCKGVALSKANDLRSYLLSDADILYFLKMNVPNDPDYVAYSSHKLNHIALWKTGAEYRKCIDDKHQFAIKGEDCAKQIRQKFHLSPDECFACDDLTRKVYDLSENAVRIEMANGETVSITSVANLPKHPQVAGDTPPLFYVYLDVEKQHLKDNIIDFINKLPANRLGYCRCQYAPTDKRCLPKSPKTCPLFKELRGQTP